MTHKYKHIVVTLFEGHYDYGVGALLNSLHDAGFEGLFCIAHKGILPFWINQLKQTNDEGVYMVTDNFFVRLDLVQIDMHFGYYKPGYLQAMKQIYPDAEGYFYFDPDIVVIGKWSFYQNWIPSGVALCQDSNFRLLHHNHPWRNKWREDFASFDKGKDTTWNYYINSGFIGCSPENFKIIDRWFSVNEVYKQKGYPITFFDQGNTLSPYKGDQDVLNAVLTLSSDIPLSPLSQDAMGFEFPIAVMAHAVDGQGIKPWKRNYIKNALRGYKASVTDEAYLNYCLQPVKLYDLKELNKKRRLLKLSKIINRVWKK